MQILVLVILICASFALGFGICTLMATYRINMIHAMYEEKISRIYDIACKSIKDNTKRKEN